MLTEIKLERLPSHDESRVETLMKSYKMGCKYQVLSLMEYYIRALAFMNTNQSVFFCRITQVAAVSRTVMPFWFGKDNQSELHDLQIPRHLQMFSKLFRKQRF